ncbi:MAG: NADPH-dependent 7-cyano-7-deazaguanine reductase QueF [Pseudomonadota bacterium]
MNTDLPLGKDTPYPDTYDPDQLFAIRRSDARQKLGLDAKLPFFGVDIWTAWELTWLDPNGVPHVGVAEIRVPADSPNLVESKSLKLYLGSFAMTTLDSATDAAKRISTDLSSLLDAAITVNVETSPDRSTDPLAGECIDDTPAQCTAYEVDPSSLRANSDRIVTETLHSHLLRSLCPVTNQPDMASVFIQYTGPQIDRTGLLQYIVSFRNHNDFHESCVEQMFMELSRRCGCEALSIYARFLRRGGIDINPYRSTEDLAPDNLAIWRQ